MKSLPSEWRKCLGIRQRRCLYNIVNTLNASEVFALGFCLFDVEHFLSLYWLCYTMASGLGLFFGHESCGILASWSHLHSLHWKAKSFPLDHHRSPRLLISKCLPFTHDITIDYFLIWKLFVIFDDRLWSWKGRWRMLVRVMFLLELSGKAISKNRIWGILKEGVNHVDMPEKTTPGRRPPGSVADDQWQSGQAGWVNMPRILIRRGS